MDYVIPTVGSIGYFKLIAPLDGQIQENEQYTCQSVRRISEMLNNNEDVFETYYSPFGFTETQYNEHSEQDMFIVGLQGAMGQWVYAPVSHILEFPAVNGIPYRMVALGFSLPALPVSSDIQYVVDEIQQLITDTLGVQSKARIVENSKVLQVTREIHDTEQAARQLVINGRTTLAARYSKLTQDHTSALNKIQELEQYILNNP